MIFTLQVELRTHKAQLTASWVAKCQLASWSKIKEALNMGFYFIINQNQAPQSMSHVQNTWDLFCVY